MQIEITKSFVEYQAQSKTLELAVSIAKKSHKISRPEVQELLALATKNRLWQKALQYSNYLTKDQIDKLVYCLVDICDANAIPYAPTITTVEPPSILVGIKGAKGDTGEEGPEGGGVPFSATNVTIDTIVDSFDISLSRAAEWTVDIYGTDGQRVQKILGGWSADGTDYGDDGGDGTDDIYGDTSPVSISVVVTGTTAQLFAQVTDGTWTIEGTRKYIPNNGNAIIQPTSLAEGKVWIGNSSNLPAAQVISGDITISSIGVASISSGVIVNSNISATAAITVSKLAPLTASKAVVTDSNGFLTVSSTSAAQIGYLSTVTSDVQVQLDSKLSAVSGAISTVVSTDLTASRAVISNPLGKIAVSSTTSAELGYVSGVTSAIQTQINSKQATITGAATTITSSNLTASRVLVSDGSGKVSVSSVSASELSITSSGTYTPTLTLVNNLDSLSNQTWWYSRVGSVVNVSGYVSANPTTNGVQVQFEVSLPVASNLGITDCAGYAQSTPSGIAEFGPVIGESVNNTALCYFTAASTSDHTVMVNFSYRII